MSRTAKAREAKQLKSQNKKEIADQHTNDLFEKKYKKSIEIIRDQYSKITELQSQVELLANTLIKYQNLLDSFIEKNGQPSNNNIMLDFLHLYLEGFDKCSDEIYKMLIDVFKSSPASFEVLRKYFTFILPIQKVEEFQNKKVPNFPETLTNKEKIHETIRFFKEENNINSKQKIYASLAVDVLFFKPDIKITSKGIVSGFINEVSLKKKDLKLLTKDLKSFTEFIRANWKCIIKAAFVYQLNPLLTKYKPIVLYIKSSSNGKANDKTINDLHAIRSILKNYRIEIVSFTFDGDNAFKNLNEFFFKLIFKI